MIKTISLPNIMHIISISNISNMLKKSSRSIKANNEFIRLSKKQLKLNNLFKRYRSNFN